MEGGRLRQRNRAANMAEMQGVALGLMRRSGFHGVTVAQVAAGAGVSPSTVYRYFGTKEALVLTGGGTDDLLAAIAAAAAQDPAATPVELFARGAATALVAGERDALLSRLQLVFADAALSGAFQHDVLERRKALAELFATHRGAAAPGVRDVAIAGALLGLLVSILDRWQGADGTKSLPKMLTKALKTLQ